MLSFDPYDCIERRWGETNENVLKNCKESLTQRQWYERQQYLRYQIDRTYDERMDFTLEDLKEWQPGNGVLRPVDLDVRNFLTDKLD